MLFRSAERAERGRPREEASGRSDARSDDTRAWFERRAASFVIPEISDFRRQRGAAREREGAFGSAIITAEVCYSLVTKHYPVSPTSGKKQTGWERRTVGEQKWGIGVIMITVTVYRYDRTTACGRSGNDSQ